MDRQTEDQLWQRVVELAAIARRAEEAGRDCTKEDDAYMEALFAFHDALLIAAAPDLLEALRGAIGALEFSRDYHNDLSNEEQAFAQDRLDAALKAIAKATGAQS